MLLHNSLILLALLGGSIATSLPFRTDGLCGLDTRIRGTLKSQEKLADLYEDYRVKHAVDHRPHETPARLEIFKAHLQKIERMRADERVSWKVGITFMSHMTECEKSLHGGGSNMTGERGAEFPLENAGLENAGLENGELDLEKRDSFNGQPLPASYDWRKHNGVASVTDQIGHTCWAHVSVVPLEAQLSVFRGKLKELSSQELIDCVDYGTEEYREVGGSCLRAWIWLSRDNHLASRSDIPNRWKRKDCTYLNQKRYTNALKGYRIQGQHSISPRYKEGESALLGVIATYTPVVINMKMTNSDMDTYRGGVFDWRQTRCGQVDDQYNTAIDHSMVMVGYTGNTYIIRNSWGTEWGEKGYLLWLRSDPTAFNCGILDWAHFPLLAKEEEETE